MHESARRIDAIACGSTHVNSASWPPRVVASYFYNLGRALVQGR
jgi:hypothetical protein